VMVIECCIGVERCSRLGRRRPDIGVIWKVV
jgi:hypothetical protein